MNERKTEPKALTALRLFLLAAGITALCVSLVRTTDRSLFVIVAAGCIIVSGVLNLLRYRENRTDDEDEDDEEEDDEEE